MFDRRHCLRTKGGDLYETGARKALRAVGFLSVIVRSVATKQSTGVWCMPAHWCPWLYTFDA